MTMSSNSMLSASMFVAPVGKEFCTLVGHLSGITVLLCLEMMWLPPVREPKNKQDSRLVFDQHAAAAEAASHAGHRAGSPDERATSEVLLVE